MSRAVWVLSLFLGNAVLAAPPPTPEPTPKESLAVLAEAALQVLEKPTVSAGAVLRSRCGERGGCREGTDASVKAFYLADAAKIRPALSPVEIDRLDCSLATLGFTGPAKKACQRADAAYAGDIADAFGVVAPDQLVSVAAQACAEVVTCARGCSAYLFAVGKVAAADRSGVPRCAEAKKVRAEKLDAWLMARTMTWLRSTLPLLDADAKRRVDAALAKHGK